MTKEVWISAKDAAEIISVNSGRPVIQQYVRELAQKGKIAYKPLDGRTNVYLRSDVEKIKVRIKKVADRQSAKGANPDQAA
jgi:ribosomal protein L19E